jgi:hypothetical protein
MVLMLIQALSCQNVSVVLHGDVLLTGQIGALNSQRVVVASGFS